MTEAIGVIGNRAGRRKHPPVNAGDRFGRLIAKHRAERRNDRGRCPPRWVCVCDCRSEKEVDEAHLKSGAIQSCGCLVGESAKRRFTKHGHAQHGARPPEYVVWQAMIRRCETPTNIGYARYAGKGVSVCARWRRDFAAFLGDMGPRPSPQHSLDRYPDYDGDYEPGNVRWATPVEQAENRRHTIWVDYLGQEMPLARAAEAAGLAYMAVYKRLKKGLPLAAVFAPSMRRG